MGYGSTNFTIPAGTYNIPKLSPNPIVSTPRLQRRATCLPISSVRSSDFRSPGWLHLVNCSWGLKLERLREPDQRICNNFTCISSLQTSAAPTPFHHGAWWRTRYQGLHQLSIRPIEIDYILTRYTNPLTSTNNQNSFRYSAGAVLHF